MAGVDRISALPVEIKISILSRLDVKYAVRTSALSRSWRHVWTLLPELTFCYFRHESSDSFLSHVDRLVSSLRGPILRFRLMMHADSTEHSTSLQRFLQIIFEKGGLDTLWMFNTGEPVQFRLPQFNSLKELNLSNCSVALPDNFKGFKCLTKLSLDEVCLSEKDLQLLVNRSRNLTTARFLLCLTEPLSVTFSSPLLTELQFRILDFVKSVKVVFAPCLRQVRISGEGFNPEEIAGATLRFMTSIACVSSLTLDYYILTCLSFLDVPVMCPFTVHFHQLKSLKLAGKFSIVNRMIYNTFCSLLKSMPFIERLEIETYGDSPGHLEPVLWDECKKQDGFCCLDQTLKSVSIIMVSFNYAIGMWMPHFLLLNTNVLKLMEIKHCTCTEAELKMLEELHQIKPISPDAKLVIGEYFPWK